ncbi:hypothetical protein ABZ897_11290 [Nonomuraea sp. NPDC046802]|uniref:hypothetical protein n=1 Tax=Nonomuraea sp. NPDC046802 TaxID=3154919 RepID=UPI0033E4A0AF
MINDRHEYDDLVARYGTPVGVEDARARWGSLIRSAGFGSITLITRERWEWAALVPLSQVSGVLSGLPVLSVSSARGKLGELVRQAAQPYDDMPILLSRHRNPVAALVGAGRLIERSAASNRVDADALLVEGHTITLALDTQQSQVTAIVRDRDGNVTAAGSGDGAAGALRSLVFG